MTLLTEKEAVLQSCPLTAFREQCKGSACQMAWRWADPPVKMKELYGTEQLPVAVAQIDPTHERRGYCGIAGRPEIHLHYSPTVRKS